MRHLFRPLRAESADFLTLDLLRFVAAAGIVVYHFSGRLGFAEPDGLTVLVDLFFVLSGLVITHVYRDRLNGSGDYIAFLRARFARLAPLHYATLAVYVALGVLMASMHIAPDSPHKYAGACILPNLTFTHSLGTCGGLSFNYASWSISAEAMVYLACPLVLWMSQASRWIHLATSLALFSLLVAFTSRAPMPFWDWTYNFGVARAVPAFLFGVSLHQLRPYLARVRAAQPATWLTLLAIFIGAFAHAPKLALLVAAYVVAALGVAADTRGATWSLVRRAAPLGQLTYSIYMLHLVVQTFGVTLVGDKLLHLSGASMTTWVTLCAAAVIPLSYLSLMLFETPARRWLRGPGHPAMPRLADVQA